MRTDIRNAIIAGGAILLASAVIIRRRRARKAEQPTVEVVDGNRDQRFPLKQVNSLPAGWSKGPLTTPSPLTLVQPLVPPAAPLTDSTKSAHDSSHVSACFLALSMEAAPEDEGLASSLISMCPYMLSEGLSKDSISVEALAQSDSGFGPLFQIKFKHGHVTALGGRVGADSKLAASLVFVGTPTDDEVTQIANAFDFDTTVEEQPAGEILVIDHNGAEVQGATTVSSKRQKLIYNNSKVGLRFTVPEGMRASVVPYGPVFTVYCAPQDGKESFSVTIAHKPAGWEAAPKHEGQTEGSEEQRSRMKHNIAMHLVESSGSKDLGAAEEIEAGGIRFTGVVNKVDGIVDRILVSESKQDKLIVLRWMCEASACSITAQRGLIDSLHFASKLF